MANLRTHNNRARNKLLSPRIVKRNLIKRLTRQGYTIYDLEWPVAYLYPVFTPIRNSIPRVSGIKPNWRTGE